MSLATTTWISGPVLKARPHGPFRLREAVTVGKERLLGEVIRVAREEVIVQVYEDTSGLRPGVEVRGSTQLLSIRLGPGILGRIFDGLLRPISDTGEPFVTPGMHDLPPASFGFRPLAQVGARLGPGKVLGEVENGTGTLQNCLVPPDLPEAEVVEIADAGQ
ncbi:MAG: ATPase, partial [Pseudomonadota bacterium]|nr:ATPase [Pseudomonadota bacterium]